MTMTEPIGIEPWLRAWQLAKDAEDAAKDARLTAELQILAILAKPETFKGTCKLDGVTVTFGESVKVDAESLNHVVSNLVASDDLPAIQALFRWKPELNAKAWKEAPDHIRNALAVALETKPSKPSFSRIDPKGK